MKITVFTSNQARHISLIKNLASEFDTVFVVQECNTLFPGLIDDFYNKSDLMNTYFKSVLAAEKTVFGNPTFLPSNIKTLSVKLGDLNFLDSEVLKPALKSDLYIVFGSSFIKGWLIDFLVDNKAVNIHMGLSPYYRGNSCNFWALYDRKPDYVGATIHLLSKGLDSGPILFHALPKAQVVDPFVLGMCAVKSAHNGLVENIRNGYIFDIEPEAQDKNLELRYTRNCDFNDDVISEYLECKFTSQEVFQSLSNRNNSELLRPYIS